MSVCNAGEAAAVPAPRINELEREQIEASDLPANWRESPSPPALANFGDDFAMRAGCCLLLAPPALAVTEKNCLINPQHADFWKILVRGVEPLTYDPRIVYPTTPQETQIKINVALPAALQAAASVQRLSSRSRREGGIRPSLPPTLACSSALHPQAHG